MATYNERFALLRSQVFRDKVGMALLTAATAIAEAATPDPKPADWDAKLAWAKDVISPNCLRWIDVAIYHVLTNSTITNAGEEASDGDIQWMVEHVLPEMITVRLS